MQVQETLNFKHAVCCQYSVDQCNIFADRDCTLRNGLQDPIGADWDPLQQGYQEIVDLIEAARSKPVASIHPLCFEPERTIPMGQRSGNIITPPVRFSTAKSIPPSNKPVCI